MAKVPLFYVEKVVDGEFAGVDIIIFGHSYIPCMERGRYIASVNPGSYRSSRTMGILELETKSLLISLEIG
ncbi:MAG: hypothetical protein MZV70_09090 [Desulfobacterales bacterium]|nr:hypothetical protein [Desulfobacterales bacterium]